MTPEQRRDLGFRRSKARKLILYWLSIKDVKVCDLAQKLGCTPQNIYKTMDGTQHSPKVLNALRDEGVPERYLYDPNNFSNANLSRL